MYKWLISVLRNTQMLKFAQWEWVKKIILGKNVWCTGSNRNGRNISDLVRKEIRSIFRTKNPTKDQIRKYKRHEKELDHNSTATFMYVRSDLMSRIIKNCRWKKISNKKINLFRCKLGFKLHDIIMCKEESVTIKIIKVFSNEKLITTLF